MAKVGMWLRGAKGKLAGNSLSKGANGQTIIREIATPTNPKTNAQCLQRMVFATATQAASALSPIIDHSFEKKSKGTPSINEFMRLNLQTLRAAALREINGDGIVSADFNLKGFLFPQANEYIVSQGSLNFPSYYLHNFGSETTATIQSPYQLRNLESANSYKEFLAMLGFDPGDQLTVVTLEVGNNTEYSKQMIPDDENSVVVNDRCVVHYQRIVFKQSFDGSSFLTLDEQSEVVIAQFSDKIIDNKRSTGTIESIYLASNDSRSNTWGFAMSPLAGMTIVGMAVIRSKRGRKNKWLRSNSTMAVSSDGCAPAKYAIYSYQDTAASDLGSDLFLNNATGSESTIESATPEADILNPRFEYSDGLASINIGEQSASATTVTGEADFIFKFSSNLQGIDVVATAPSSGTSEASVHYANGSYVLNANVALSSGQAAFTLTHVSDGQIMPFYEIRIIKSAN